MDAVIVEAGVASAEATAHDATVKTESAISAELTVEREHLIQAAIRTLIETVTVAQAESARAAEKLNGLTVELVQWTRIIGSATIVAVVVGIAALAFAIYIAANPQPGP